MNTSVSSYEFNSKKKMADQKLCHQLGLLEDGRHQELLFKGLQGGQDPRDKNQTCKEKQSSSRKVISKRVFQVLDLTTPPT